MKFGKSASLRGLDELFITPADKDRFVRAGERAFEAQSTPPQRKEDNTPAGGQRRSVQPSILSSLRKGTATPEAGKAQPGSAAKRRRRDTPKKKTAEKSAASFEDRRRARAAASDDELLSGI